METSESQHKLLEFKKKTNLCRVVTYWGNKYELASQVTVSLIRVFKDWPRVGWIKDNASKNEWLENVFGNIFLSYSWKDHVIADDTDIFDIIGMSKYIRYW